MYISFTPGLNSISPRGDEGNQGTTQPVGTDIYVRPLSCTRGGRSCFFALSPFQVRSIGYQLTPDYLSCRDKSPVAYD